MRILPWASVNTVVWSISSRSVRTAIVIVSFLPASVWRDVAGGREYTTEIWAYLGKKMTQWHRPVMPIRNKRDGDRIHFPWLGHADRMFVSWWGGSLRAAVGATRPEQGKLIGATDWSQLCRKGCYGWMTIDQVNKYNTSGKMVSYTRELESYTAEMHAAMWLMAVVWTINSCIMETSSC